MNPHELRAHRRQVDALIRANPLTIRLQRQVKLATASGGYDSHPTSLEPQVFLLVETAGRGRLEGTISRAEGQLLKADWILIGHHNVDIKRGDTYQQADDFLIVDYVSPYKTIRVAAGIKIMGSNDVRELQSG